VILSLLVANRGEIAVRIMATAAVLGVRTVAVHPADDADSLHVARADAAALLPGSGPRAYLSVPDVIAAALEHGCDAVHPGYGFLSENPALARACADAGLVFVGPSAAALELFGDKTAARAQAASLGIRVPAAAAAADAAGLLDEVGAVMVKAVAGGGGRGMRPVRAGDDLADALVRAAAEAGAAFGDDTVYVEQLLTDARHIEVQVLGDGEAVVVLGDRDCSVQRRRQKLIELAPAPALSSTVRDVLHADAARLIGSVPYSGLATVEFLVAADATYFLEVNPRLQVEHTVTEQVTGLDLVELALRVAAGSLVPPAPESR
jgi:acetyl/propionyl-CoA carboxylase alpha subunit